MFVLVLTHVAASKIDNLYIYILELETTNSGDH